MDTAPKKGKIRIKLDRIAFFLLGIVSAIIVALIISGTSFPRQESTEKTVFIEYGFSFSGMEMRNDLGDRVVFPECTNDYSLVFSLSSGCKACIEKLHAIGELSRILGGDFADIVVLWSRECPWDQIEGTGLLSSQNYILDNTHLGNGVPHYYISDKNGTVLFSCENLDELITKLISLDGINLSELQRSADTYLLERLEATSDSEGPILVEFSMGGCPDCEAAYPIVNNETIQSAFNQYTLYCDNMSSQNELFPQIDYGNVLADIYGIRWYPSFVVFRENERTIVGETPIDSLESTLLATIKDA